MKKKKLLSWIAFLVIIGLLLPIIIIVIKGTTVPPEKSITLGATMVKGAGDSHVYFGLYRQSSNDNGEYKTEPISWRVLSNENGAMFLLAEQNLDVKRYHEEYESVTWETSTLRSWLNGLAANKGNGDKAVDYTSVNFLDQAFTVTEQSAIVDTVLTNPKNATFGTSGGNNTTDKVFLLSYEDVLNPNYGFVGDENNAKERKATNTAYTANAQTGGQTVMNGVGEADSWWLRSPGYAADYAVIVNEQGRVYGGGEIVPYMSVAVRPTMNISHSSVLFTSAAKGGKSAFQTVDGTKFSENSNLSDLSDHDGYKLTLLDNTRKGFVAELKDYSNNVATVSYSGSKTGTNEYISAIIKNGETVKYYGRLSNAQSDGTLSISLPNDFNSENGDVLCVFNEQYNGDYLTDYASEFVELKPISSKPVESSVPSIPSEVPQLRYGDVNDDGKIGATDALVVLKASVGKIILTEKQKIVADVDEDGKQGAKDALEILKYSVGNPSALDNFYQD